MTHYSYSELEKIVRGAHRQCPTGSMWRHVGSGDIYVVMTIVLREEDLEPLVVYRRIDLMVQFARPVGRFVERFGRESADDQ